MGRGYTGRMTDYPRNDATGEGTGVFAEIRRQMEEMMRGQRPPGPTVIPGDAGTRKGGGNRSSNTGIAMAAMASYWALPIIARKKRKARLRQRRQDADANGTGGAARA